jgi:hypothetical protein
MRAQMRQVGVPLAENISRIAQEWCNEAACNWADELAFKTRARVKNDSLLPRMVALL